MAPRRSRSGATRGSSPRRSPTFSRCSAGLRETTAREMGRALSMYAEDPEEYDPEGMKKNVRPETAAELERLIAKLERVVYWTAPDLDAALRELAAEMKIPASRLIHPTRLALTGVTVGAPLFDVVALLGKETALRRMRKFVERIRRDK